MSLKLTSVCCFISDDMVHYIIILHTFYIMYHNHNIALRCFGVGRAERDVLLPVLAAVCEYLRFFAESINHRPLRKYAVCTKKS